MCLWCSDPWWTSTYKYNLETDTIFDNSTCWKIWEDHVEERGVNVAIRTFAFQPPWELAMFHEVPRHWWFNRLQLCCIWDTTPCIPQLGRHKNLGSIPGAEDMSQLRSPWLPSANSGNIKHWLFLCTYVYIYIALLNIYMHISLYTYIHFNNISQLGVSSHFVKLLTPTVIYKRSPLVGWYGS